jgi:DeoR family glycerol-3-phosphate regulon repressor
VRVSKVIMARARQVFLVADQSKLGRKAPARLASLAQVSAWFTDATPPADLALRCAEWQTRVVVG